MYKNKIIMKKLRKITPNDIVLFIVVNKFGIKNKPTKRY